MAERKRTHEIFSAPAEVRIQLVERLIESVMDEEVDAELRSLWEAKAHRRLREPHRGGRPAEEIFREIQEEEIKTRSFRLNPGIRIGVARELIDSLDELEDTEREALRQVWSRALSRSVERTAFTLG